MLFGKFAFCKAAGVVLLASSVAACAWLFSLCEEAYLLASISGWCAWATVFALIAFVNLAFGLALGLTISAWAVPIWAIMDNQNGPVFGALLVGLAVALVAWRALYMVPPAFRHKAMIFALPRTCVGITAVLGLVTGGWGLTLSATLNLAGHQGDFSAVFSLPAAILAAIVAACTLFGSFLIFVAIGLARSCDWFSAALTALCAGGVGLLIVLLGDSISLYGQPAHVFAVLAETSGFWLMGGALSNIIISSVIEGNGPIG